MSWSSVSYSNGTMPTDLTTSSSSSSNSYIVGGDPIPTLIAQGNVNNNNSASNDRMSMESVSSLSSTHSLLPYSTMLASAVNNITMTRYGDSNNTSSAPSESETPKQPPLPPRHRSVSVSGIKSAFAPPPPHSQTASASPNVMMSTPSFSSRTLQPMENRMEAGLPVSGQVNDDSAAGAGAAPSDGFDFLKSPTTLTFERMIEACT
jgi:hypothetical protein